MQQYGWTSWGWYQPTGPGIPDDAEPLRRWKREGRHDLFIDTNDDDVLLFVSGLLMDEGL